jgi:myosin heavy subunit
VTHHLCIGLLDIFGFEIFDSGNSLEQLCINFTNEKLQAQFNNHTFTEEQKIYKAEGFNIEIKWQSNEPVMKLIESEAKGVPLGLMPQLDECLKTNKKDNDFMKEIEKNHQKGGSAGGGSVSSRFAAAAPSAGPAAKPLFKVVNKAGDKTEFQVLHYAAQVTYTVTGFIDKNRDSLDFGLQEMVVGTTNATFQKLVRCCPLSLFAHVC